MTFPGLRAQNPHETGALPVPGGKAHPFLHDSESNGEEQALLILPIYLTKLIPICVHDFPLFIKLSIKTLRFQHFCGSSLPYKPPVSRETHNKNV